MNLHAYLQRIDCEGPLDPTAETLRRLHVAHLRAVPFENLSIHNREPIVLADDALFEKIVTRRRGGFCYELNGLFAALCRELGFNVRMLSAKVAKPEGGFSPDFDHMALLFECEGLWLADVGFGDSFLEPLKIDEQKKESDGRVSCRLRHDAEYFVLEQRAKDQAWNSQYRFALTPYQYCDYAERCRYHQTSPQSHFTQSRICSRATPEGRLTLSGMRFITTSSHGRTERLLSSEAEYATILHEQFGVVMAKHQSPKAEH